ncbi:MAG: hypothetical protein AAF479_05595 [Pseudomonadota bacterium]
MTARDRKRRINNALLLCFWLVPGLFWYFAINMALYRAEARELAEKMKGEVIHQQEVTYSCKGSDKKTRTCTHWLYEVRFDLNGDKIARPLLDARFDPKYVEHTDGFDHEAYPVGATMPILLRRDLDHAIAPDFFWSAYLMPVVLAGFGAFVSIFVIIGISLGWDRSPRTAE